MIHSRPFSKTAKICRGAGLVGDTLLQSDDIDDRWEEYIKDYVADAVENFNQYPEAAISWAGFLGIGVAHWWDMDWQEHRRQGGEENLGHPAELRYGHSRTAAPRGHRDTDRTRLLRAHAFLFGTIQNRRRHRTPAPRLQGGADTNPEIVTVTVPASLKAGYQALCKGNWLFSRSARLFR